MLTNFRRWWNTSSRKVSRRGSSRRNPLSFRPQVGMLEDRVVPASLGYSTFLNATIYGEAVDSAGNVYVTGTAYNSFVTTPGAYETSGYGGFVAKLNPSGTAVIYATLVGGSKETGIAVDSAGDAYVIDGGLIDELNPTGTGLLYSTTLADVDGNSNSSTMGDSGAIAIDGSGNIYVAGAAFAGLATTAGAFQSTDNASSGSFNAYFAKIDPNLPGSAALVYCSYLGGNSGDAATGIAIDSAGNAYVTGYSSSTNFPTTSGAFQTARNSSTFDAFVAKFNPSLSGAASLVYSTDLGGSGNQGYISDGTGLYDARNDGGIAVDSAGNAYITGSTTSKNFPTTAGAYQVQSGLSKSSTNFVGDPADVFVTKLNATGSTLVYSTFIGNTSRSGGTSIALDSSDDAYLTGWTNSSAYPTKNSVQGTGGGSVYDAFVTVLNPAGSGLLFSSYLGGSGGRDEGMALALDSQGNTYVGGFTDSSNFPTTPGAYQTIPDQIAEGFASKITAPVGPTFTISGPAGLSAGMAGTFTLTALNHDGTADTGYSGTVQITSSDPHAVLPGEFTVSGGVASFSAVLETAGPQSIAAADVANASINGSDAGIAVAPGAASQVVFTQVIASGVAGQTLGTIKAGLEDAFGNLETSDNSDSITLSVHTGPSPQLGGTTTATVQAGIATFSNLLLNTSGSYTLAAFANPAGGGTLGPVFSSGIAIASPVSVSLGTITYNSTTGLYSETVTLTNTSGAALTGPLSLELTNLPYGVSLNNATGTTNGNPYFRFLSTGTKLKKDAELSITLTFTAASLSDITFGTEVVVGL